MDFATKYISAGIAKVEVGLNDRVWRRFRNATKLPIYRIPGGGNVVDRTQLDTIIGKAREAIEPEIEGVDE
jgi:hypothetical protein